MKLTKTAVEQAPVPASGQVFYRDEQLKGFALRVTASGVKSFVVEKRIHGRVKRKTLGRFGPLTAEKARKDAQSFLGQVASGQDPISEQKDREAHWSVTGMSMTIRDGRMVHLKLLLVFVMMER